MLFSIKGLSQFVDLSTIDLKELRNRLTFSGFEVEEVQEMASASNLVIGQVLTCVNHPDSDHLHILTVDCGNEGIKNIVCGAPNVKEGLKVIVALEGCVLPALGVTIKKGAIRNVPSEGMCCSLLELGVDKESLEENSPSLNGIEELPEDAPVGLKDVLAYLHIDDTIFDINVLPNRPDCLSYIGMAREISSLLSLPMKELPSFDLTFLPKQEDCKTSCASCARFDLVKINNVVLKKETPLFVKRVLMANGIRPLSPIVDLGNYSMLLTGQPLNMYDDDFNKDSTYVARDDYEGKFVAFDGRAFDLVKGDIVIASSSSTPLCLAGIMAGQEASVKADTKNIAIEAASFYHANIRHTCARLGLSSPSSILFGKGRNPKMIPEALSVTLGLLPLFFESYEIVSYSSDNKAPNENQPFFFDKNKLNERLGSCYTEEEIDRVLQAYRIQKVDEHHLLAPLDRVDINEQCDIEEEVFRYYPAEKILPSFTSFPVTRGKLSPSQKAKREIRETLIHRGLCEILSFTLVSEKEDKQLRVFNQEESYRIINPMTKDHEIVRSDLLSSMLLTMKYNMAHQKKDLALFEISDVDTKKGVLTYLSIGLSGFTCLAQDYKARPYDFYDLKGMIEVIFQKLGINPNRYRLAYSKNPYFHPNCSCDIFMGKDLIGTFGKLHPSFEKEEIYLAELNLSYLLNLKGSKTKFVPFSSYPTVRRDLSFKMRDGFDFATLKKTILKAKGTYLKDVLFFDDFTDKVTGGHFLGVSLILGKEDGTLKDAEIQASIAQVVSVVKSELSLTLRGE